MNPEYLKSKFQNFRSHPFRPGQSRGISFIIDSPRKHNILCSPQGSGKSLIGMCAGAHYGRFLYLCSSKFLQAQLASDYPEAQLMQGRNNFQCNLIPRYTAAECIYSTNKKNCPEKRNCNYEVRKAEVLSASYQILNYHYMLFESNYIGKFSDYDLIICDEADTLEGILSNFISLKLSKRFIYDLHIKTPARRTSKAQDSIPAWMDWINDTLYKTITRQKKLTIQSQDTPDIDPSKLKLIKQINYLKSITSKLKLFLSNLDKTWLFDDHNGYEFKPTWLLSEFTHEYFFRHANKFLFMSATFPPKQIFAKQLAIPADQINTLELTESAFPVSNRPVILNPVANLKYKTFDIELPKLLKAIKLIIAQHKDEKGLIHTISWKLNKAVMNIGSPRLITHDSSNKEEQLDTFKQSKSPLIFVSPSSMRGLDLYDDLCVPGNTLVRTSKGYKEISKIQIGDRVWSHKGKYRKVTEIFKRPYNSNLIEIKPYGSPPILLTPNHPVLISKYGKTKVFCLNGIWIKKPYKKKHVSLDWVEAKNLIGDEMLCLAIGSKFFRVKPLGTSHITGRRRSGGSYSQVPNQWEDTPEFWELVGLWAAEGSMGKNKTRNVKRCGQSRTHWTIQWSFGWHEEHTLAKRCTELIEIVLKNKKPTPYVYGSGTVVSIKNDPFAVWLRKNLKTGARNKKVPNRLIHHNNSHCKQAFLNGYFNGDGYLNNKGNSDRYETVSVSFDLSIGVRDLALSLGYEATINRGTNKYGDLWPVSWTNSKKCRAKNVRGRYLIAKPNYIKTVHYSGELFNLEIETDQSYSLIGLTVHNCRFAIITKFPWQSLKDKLVSARVYSGSIGSEWFVSDASQELIQACGRHIRHDQDYGITYILDTQAVDKILKSQKYFPQYFFKSLKLDD